MLEIRRIALLWSALCAICFPSQTRSLHISGGESRAQGSLIEENRKQPIPEQREEGTGTGNSAAQDDLAKVQKDIKGISYKSRNIRRILENTQARVTRNVKSFFPGWAFNLSIFISALMITFIGLLSFIVYYTFFYQPDRTSPEYVAQWKEPLAALECDDYGEFSPDVIIVFHHPDFSYDDNEDEVTPAQIIDAMVESDEFEETFPELAEARMHVSSDAFGQMSKKVKRMTEKLGRISSPQSPTKSQNAATEGKNAEQVEEGKPLGLTTQAARLALLQNLYKYLHKRGFDIAAFQSIDADEIFLCTTLKHTRTINSFLAADDLALSLNPGVVANLTDQRKPIQHDAKDPAFEPPLIQYKPSLVRTLQQLEVIESADELEVFKPYERCGTMNHISGKMAIQITLNQLAGVLDLDAAQEHSMIASWFPVHAAREVERFKAIWGNFAALKDISFVQPIDEIRDYFGARIAFLFAWNGVYCKALLVLVMTSVLWLLTVMIAKYVFKSDVFNERQVIGFAITLCIWCKIANNMWKREENFFIEYWGMAHPGVIDSGHGVRPSFIGQYEPSPLNANIKEKQYPKHKALARRFASAAATLVVCGFTLIVIWTWMIMFEDEMGPVSALVLSLIIISFRFISQCLVKVFVDFENHKYCEDYFNSFLWKLFLFEYVNNYSAFFFFSIRNSDEALCQGESFECKIQTLSLLRSQVSMTQIILVICSVIQVLTNMVLTKWKLWVEDYQYRKTFQKDPPERSWHEEQAKLAKVDEATEVQNMMTLVIALGFLFHFGGVAPLSVVVTLVLFAVQLRAFAKVLLFAQRIVPQGAKGIGNWANVLDYLMVSGVVYTAFMVVVYGAAFGDAPQQAKQSAFILFCIGIFVAWKLVDVFFPVEDGDAELLHERRNYLSKLLMKLEHKEDLEQLQVAQSARGETIYQAIEKGEFSKLPFRWKAPAPTESASIGREWRRSPWRRSGFGRGLQDPQA